MFLEQAPENLGRAVFVSGIFFRMIYLSWACWLVEQPPNSDMLAILIMRCYSSSLRIDLGLKFKSQSLSYLWTGISAFFRDNSKKINGY